MEGAEVMAEALKVLQHKGLTTVAADDSSSAGDAAS